MEQNKCKICGGQSLEIFAHTAKCGNCGVLLFYPYPDDDTQLLSTGEGKSWPRREVLSWYSRSSFFNHTNFTNMLRFVMSEPDKLCHCTEELQGRAATALVFNSVGQTFCGPKNPIRKPTKEENGACYSPTLP